MLTPYFSYNEALPLMYSEPLFVISKPARIFLVDHAKFFTLRNIRKLHVRMYFFNFPQDEGPSDKWCNMAGWIHICNSLASMPNLTYLCITIVQDAFRLESRSPDRNVELLNGLFEPLKSIKVVSEGQFDVVTQGWRLPFELTDAPFRLLEERPPITPLAKFRLQELGGLSEPLRRSPVSIPKARP